MSETLDVLVLGAGSVGAASAAHLAARGLAVGLVDSRRPGRQTSYGNAGIIDPAAFLPHPFPRNVGTLIRQLSGATPHAHVHWRDLPSIAGWLFDYFRASAPDRIDDSAARLAPLTAHAVAEHDALAAAAGAAHLIRHTGWLYVYRSRASFETTATERRLLERFGAAYDVLDEAGIAAAEPHLKPGLTLGLFMPSASSTSDPGALVAAYADLAVARGARFITAEARDLFRSGERWVLPTDAGGVTAAHVVVALGPWAAEFLRPYGLSVPIAVKRGYHMHYAPDGNATLTRPIGDPENGYCLTPMARGHRMTTGAEFARRDAPPTPVQVARAEARARTLFPLGMRAEAEPWMGARPNTPDGVPIIGPAPGQPGMTLAIGHGHWGLGLGAVTGRLVADLVTGATPIVDPAPYGLERFG